MADIFQDFPINVSLERVFRAVSTPEGLDSWWTKGSSGVPHEGALYDLSFGPGYDWRAQLTRHVPEADVEFTMVRADDDWLGTRVRLQLERREAGTWVQFSHMGWPGANEHYRISCHCWALYLRVLRRSLEHGEAVPYEQRLDV